MSDKKHSSNALAKMRWKILAKALQEGQVHETESSIRKFSSYKLVHLNPSTGTGLTGGRGFKWYECTCHEDPLFLVYIRLLSKKITIESLKGFDNTGNICIWPSEEVLAYYCMKNKEMFSNKTVCELGGGMTCIAGMAVASSTDAKEVFLTDGNNRSLQNVKVIVEKNTQNFGSTNVFARLMRWDCENDMKEFKEYFDIIICADCCYQESSRGFLVNCIKEILKPNGVVVIMAPLRGGTFQKFVDLAQAHFAVDKLLIYDTHVWDLHVKLKQNAHYDEDLHYPQMLILRKDPVPRGVTE